MHVLKDTIHKKRVLVVKKNFTKPSTKNESLFIKQFCFFIVLEVNDIVE